MEYLTGVVSVINYRLAHLGPLNIGNSPFIEDSRVQVQLVAIYEHRNTSVIGVPDADQQFETYVEQDNSGYDLTWSDKYEVEHMLLPGANGPGNCCGGRTSDIGEQGWILYAGWYAHYLQDGPTSYSWTIPGHFIHELGHAMNLSHNYIGAPYGVCDSCQDNDAIPGGPCPSQGTSNNYMDVRLDTPGSINGYNANTPDPGFPACQLGRAHYALEGSGGNTVTIWRTVVKDYCAHDPNETITISGTHTWNDSKKLKGDLVITTGSMLTVKCRVHMPWGAKVIVQPGARLVIDEGHFTNLCDQFWSGIEVWGDNTHNQSGNPIPTHQGMLVLKNGATIEHAREAINLMQGGVWGTFGGVVQATDANFINCRRSAQFLEYQNTSSGGAPIANRSYFKRCHFYVDDDYRGGDDFFAHTSLWKVDGIRFIACTFENLQTTISESAKLGRGIVSLDASYSVLGECAVNPPWVGGVCPSYTPTVFRGLDHGIDAGNLATARNFTVDHCRFEDNICGVYAHGVVGFKVKNSRFLVGGNEVPLTGDVDGAFNDRHRGVFSTESWAFAIDDNEVEQNGSHDLTEGIVVGYTRDHNDVVFRNQATGLERAYIGEGICADIDPGYAAIRGLWFLCDENHDNATDFQARKVTWAQEDQNQHTIRLNQGAPGRPADNTFDEWPNGSTTNWDFRVTTTHAPMTYRHRNVPPYLPVNFTSGSYGIFPFPATSFPQNNCAGKTLLGGTIDPNYSSGMAPGPVVSYLLSEKLAYGNARYLYEQLIDDGNTDEVVQEIQESWPQDAWALRDYLLSKSPYLSVTALKEMVLRGILPDAMVTEILVANPEATRSDGFLAWLQEESGHPLPEYMLGMVVASWDQRTYRDALEGEMALHHGEMTQAANMLVHHYQALPMTDDDSTSVRMDSVLWAWRQLRTPAARYAEALTWLQSGNYAQATATIDTIPLEHDLRAPEMLERQRMLDLIAFLQALHGSGRSALRLDSTEVASLQVLMGDAYDRPAALISNLLCFGYGICRPPLTGGEDSGEPKRLPYTPLPTKGAAAQALLKAHPNPANTWVAFDYDLLTEPAEAALVIRDITGREVYRTVLRDKRQQVVWDTRQATPGSYTVVLLNAGRQLGTEKLVIRQ